ncbi:hypothetical protein Tco_1208873, partial [Tanacetum coccineum]
MHLGLCVMSGYDVTDLDDLRGCHLMEEAHQNIQAEWSFRRAPRSGVKQDQLTDLMTYVEGVDLGVTPDRWYWTLDGSGEFLVASARKVIDDNRFSEETLKLDG